MENFFIEDEFYSDLSDLIDREDCEPEELPDDWSVEAIGTELEKIFELKEDFIIDAILNKTDTWDERFPEEADRIFEKIKVAVKQGLDVKKINDLLPSLYYPSNETWTITKNDLIEYCKP